MEVKEKNQSKSKEEICGILEANGIPFDLSVCNNYDGYQIVINGEQSKCCAHSIIVQSCNKDTFYRIYPQEIIYIAIENRKSVLYLSDKVIETNYHISHWTEVLDKRVFAQPHYSFIVNLNYVYDVSKDTVILKCADKEFSVYVSSRKFRSFKKALFAFYDHNKKDDE